MQLLGCLPPSLEPRATEHIGAMIATIQRIIEHGHAYAVEGGDVFFDVASLPGYGRLSGRQQVGLHCAPRHLFAANETGALHQEHDSNASGQSVTELSQP